MPWVTVDPRSAEPVFDERPAFRGSRLWLESVLRRSPVPVSDTRIAVCHRALLDRMDFQLRPAERALRNYAPLWEELYEAGFASDSWTTAFAD